MTLSRPTLTDTFAPMSLGYEEEILMVRAFVRHKAEPLSTQGNGFARHV
jgi:hypothetical protein